MECRFSSNQVVYVHVHDSTASLGPQEYTACVIYLAVLLVAHHRLYIDLDAQGMERASSVSNPPCRCCSPRISISSRVDNGVRRRK